MAKTSFLSYNLTLFHHFKPSNFSQAHVFNPLCHILLPKHNEKFSFSSNRSFQSFIFEQKSKRQASIFQIYKTLSFNPSRRSFNVGSFGTNMQTKRNFVVFSNNIEGFEKGNPSPSGPPSGRNWKRWVVGIVISVILPFFTNKLGPLAIWKDEFDSRLQTIEDVVETGEKVADVVEKVAEKWVDRLPAGWLKDAVTTMEQASEKAAKFFHIVDDAIDEFQEKEENIEVFIESALEKAKDSAEKEKNQK